jgi:hypothetical protein
VLSDPEIERFSRHILLREVGGAGQDALRRAAVKVDRLDVAERACLLWLARAGVSHFALPEDSSPAPALDPSGLLLPGDVGHPLRRAVASRLSLHAPDVELVNDGVRLEAGSTVESGARAALDFMRSAVSAKGSPP